MPGRNDKITNREIGRRVRQAREDLGLTQADLAKAVGMSQNTISRWESGERSIVINDLETVAAVLSKPIIYFVTTNPARPPQEWDDYPEELRQAMAYVGEMDPEHRPYMYKLWLGQAEKHAEIARRKKELEAEVARLEARREQIDDK